MSDCRVTLAKLYPSGTEEPLHHDAYLTMQPQVGDLIEVEGVMYRVTGRRLYFNTRKLGDGVIYVEPC